jgi:ParB family chromosome partitioning protein
VRAAGDGYELIAGERRLRAATAAGLAEVPVKVMQVDDREALELALVENLQREDLDPIEEAEGYRSLLERFQLTQEQIAERVGKARATVANALRLLALPADVRRMVEEGALSAGHAKALLGLALPAEQSVVAGRVAKEALSVRATEKLVARLGRPPRKPRAFRPDVPEVQRRHLEEQMREKLGTAVAIHPSRTLSNGRRARGTLVIDFHDADDLDRLLLLLGITDSF